MIYGGDPKIWDKIIQHGWFSMGKPLLWGTHSLGILHKCRKKPDLRVGKPIRRWSFFGAFGVLWQPSKPLRRCQFYASCAALCQSLPLLILGIFNYLQHSSALSSAVLPGAEFRFPRLVRELISLLRSFRKRSKVVMRSKSTMSIP